MVGFTSLASSGYVYLFDFSDCIRREVKRTTPAECYVPEDCPNAPYSVCNVGVCEHKGVYPFLPKEIVGIIVLPILLGLANIAGIGGGGVVIPLAMGCWGFETTAAVAISNSTVFLGAIIRYSCFSIKEKHPHADRTVIDYNIASIMIPAVFLGSFTGLYLAKLIPEAVITIILTVILFYMTYNTYKKTLSLCKKESQERQNYQEIEEDAMSDKLSSCASNNRSFISKLSRSRLERGYSNQSFTS